MQLFWGDIHNHTNAGYGQGSIARAAEIARGRLDFWAAVAHAQFHGQQLADTGSGFKARVASGMGRAQQQWSEMQQVVQAAYQPGRFVSLLGYEWHSTQYGDHVLLYPDATGALVYFDDIVGLQAHARTHNCLLIPHHLGYQTPGSCGHDWSTHDQSITPVVEIYSEHGAFERDRGPFPSVRHSIAGRETASCAQTALINGQRFGFVASTDDHLGCPGAYPEGLAGVYAESLTRESIWEALRARRTIAATGDRIAIRLYLNGSPIGSEIPWTSERALEIKVVGWDEIDKVELIKNNHVIERLYPAASGAAGWPERARFRIEFGWGEWIPSRELAVRSWKMSLEVEGGRIVEAMPCFRSRPFREDSRPGIKALRDRWCTWEAQTTQRYAEEGVQCFEDSNCQGMALEIAGPPETRLVLQITEPVKKQIVMTLAELAERNHLESLGIPRGEWVVLHRLVLPHEYGVDATVTDSQPSRHTDYYYVRTTQANGQMAWTSPIWVEAPE